MTEIPKTFKAKHHIKIDDFSFVEIEVDETAAKIVEQAKWLVAQFKEQK